MGPKHTAGSIWSMTTLLAWNKIIATLMIGFYRKNRFPCPNLMERLSVLKEVDRTMQKLSVLTLTLKNVLKDGSPVLRQLLPRIPFVAAKTIQTSSAQSHT